MFHRDLGNGYTLRELEAADFGPLWESHAKAIFDDNLVVFRYRDFLTPEANQQAEALKARLGTPYRLNLGLYHGEVFVGWSWGLQESSEAFYMVNSAVLPEHRGRGLYQALVGAVTEVATAMGFQRLYSRHVATNNAVIVPKLKQGFVITGFELSDRFGTLVHLTYFPDPLRRQVLDYRAGQIRPDADLKHKLGL